MTAPKRSKKTRRKRQKTPERLEFARHVVPPKRHKNLKRWLTFSGVLATFLGSAALTLIMWPQSSVSLASSTSYPVSLRTDYSSVVRASHKLESRQATLNSHVVSQHDLDLELSRIQIDATSGRFGAATNDIKSLRQALSKDRKSTRLNSSH